MNTITIPTSQNIELEYPIASIGDRILATCIDLMLQLGYLLLLNILQDGLDFSLSDTASIIIFLPVMCYSLACEVFFDGQSVGKYLLKTRVIRLDGSSPGISAYFLRWMLRLVDIFAFSGAVGIISILISKKGQRLGDLVAGTTVVKLRLVTSFADTIFMNLDQDYELAFPEIENLSDQDMSILKEVLDAGIRSNNPELLEKLSEKVKEVTGIESKMPHRLFLETILRDYNYVFGRS
jgi:uncharacterized RDD family membrane protein YckC